MQDQFFVRMGDGERVLMSSDQIKEDLLAGTQEAAERAEIPVLTADEVEQLFDIIADPSRIVSVAPGSWVSPARCYPDPDKTTCKRHRRSQSPLHRVRH